MTMDELINQIDPALILIVDDSEEMRTQLKHYLTSDGYRFVEAANGKDALSLFENHKQIVLTSDRTPSEMAGLAPRLISLPMDL